MATACYNKDMKKIIAVVNKKRNGFTFPSDYNRATLLGWFKKYSKFEIIPAVNESIKVRGYLEGAIMPAYCEWQYKISSKMPGMHEQQRMLFKRDFNSEIVEDRDGNPVRAPLSSKGKANELVKTYSQWAEQNGAPIPNPDLYKLWRDKWKDDVRFSNFFEFLKFLDVECDAMPSSETLEKLSVDEVEIEYPTETVGEPKF